MLMPSGDINADDGRKFKNANTADVVKASAAKIDLVIDYEHQTDYAKQNGQPAPAAGWIKELAARADGIWGRVEWTDKAKAYLAAKEFRYLSPTFLHDKAGNVQRILRAALLNSPAIHELPALAKSQQTGTDPMDVEQYLALCQALGLAEGTAVDAVIKTAKAAQTVATEAADTTAALCSSLDLDQNASVEDVTAAVTSLKATATATAIDNGGTPDPAQFVSMAAFQEQSGALKTLQDTIAAATANDVVEKAMAAGKVTPANRDWALALARTDPGSFDDFVKNAPVIIAPGTATPSGDITAKATALDADEKSMCAAMSISEEQFLATKNEGID